MQFLVDAVVALIGLAHAAAAYFYFSRERIALLTPMAWLAATAACLFIARTNAWLGYGLFIGIVAVWTLWWTSIRPSKTANWVDENKHQATAELSGNTLTVHHVRNFEWHSKRDAAPRWETRRYDLTKLVGLDLFVCTWGAPRIAHTIVSFDFGDDHPLCFSIETRREVGEKWTALAGFMRSYELILIAGVERDLVRSRVNIRGETVRLYRIASERDMQRKVLLRYVAHMNRLAKKPRFYNTVFSNCTTEIARLVYAAGHRFPLNWRLLVSGYVGEYLFDLKLLDTSRPFQDLKRDADIAARSHAADADSAYSRRIRDGLIDPGTPADVRRRENKGSPIAA
jgi:hypothetical protein